MDEMKHKLVQMIAKETGVSLQQAESVVDEVFPLSATPTRLQRIRELRNTGRLTEAEYQAEKAKLLSY